MPLSGPAIGLVNVILWMEDRPGHYVPFAVMLHCLALPARSRPPMAPGIVQAWTPTDLPGMGRDASDNSAKPCRALELCP